MYRFGETGVQDANPEVMPLHPVSFYAHEIRPALPASLFSPARSRMAWLPVHIAIAALAAVTIVERWVPLWFAPVLSVVIGVSFGCLAFLAHEALHGGIVRGRRLMHVFGFVGFLPFFVSPTLWHAWHNLVHHRYTNHPERDPDAYPTLETYRRSRGARIVVDHFALGGNRWTGVLSLLFSFTFMCLHVLGFARKREYLSRRAHWLAIAETAAGVALWAAVAWLVGPLSFLFIYALPILVANAIVMSFIVTNHSLSPLTEVNDPLVNALTVTLPPWLEWITMGFGLHVEHHLFPAMSPRYAPAVRRLLLERWPQQYQSMPLTRALRLLHRTARVYKDATTLIDPPSGREYATLHASDVQLHGREQGA